MKKTSCESECANLMGPLSKIWKFFYIWKHLMNHIVVLYWCLFFFFAVLRHKSCHRFCNSLESDSANLMGPLRKIITWKYLMNHRSCYTGVISSAVPQHSSCHRLFVDFWSLPFGLFWWCNLYKKFGHNFGNGVFYREKKKLFSLMN